MKIKRQVRSKFVKSGTNETIGQINKTIGHVNESIQCEELKNNNKTTTCADKYKQNLSAYDIKGKENNSSTSENK